MSNNSEYVSGLQMSVLAVKVFPLLARAHCVCVCVRAYVRERERERERHVLTEETLDDINILLEANSKKLLCLFALQCALATSTVHIGTKLLKLWP
jgi:hypothetical protein